MSDAPPPNDDDLDLLRAFRADEADLDVVCGERIAGRVWEQVFAAEATPDRSRGLARRWRSPQPPIWLRPALAGAAATLAIGMGVLAATDTVRTDSATSADPASVNAPPPTIGAGVQASLFGSASVAPRAGGSFAPMMQVDAREDRSTTMQDVEGTDPAVLPRDAETLRELLRGATEPDAAGDAEQRAFILAMRWETAVSTPDDLRATFLQAIAGLDGIEVLQRGSDLLGRPGVVVGRVDQATGIQTQFVLAPGDGELLERRAFVTRWDRPGCPPGTWVAFSLHTHGYEVTPELAPWASWPTVVPSCGASTTGT